jgi:hypothetical protein
MNHFDVPPAESGNDVPVAGSQAELSEADLECVVGGLARPWNEGDPDAWQLEPAQTVL